MVVAVMVATSVQPRQLQADASGVVATNRCFGSLTFAATALDDQQIRSDSFGDQSLRPWLSVYPARTPMNAAAIEDRLRLYPGLPRPLFKYRTATHKEATACLRAGRLTAPNPISLNDPFDSKPHSLLRNSSEDERHLLLEWINDRTRFLCFTGADKLDGTQNDILRWSHYAEGHRGFCLMISDPWLSENAKPIEYPPLYQAPDSAPAEYSTFWRREGFFKAPVWTHEEEYRVLLPENSSPTYHLAPGTIWGIAFGCWSRRQERRKLLAAVFEHSPQCEVFQARVHPRQWGLVYETINRDGDVVEIRGKIASGRVAERRAALRTQSRDRSVANPHPA